MSHTILDAAMVNSLVHDREQILARDPSLRNDYYIFSLAYNLAKMEENDREGLFAATGVSRDPVKRQRRIEEAIRKLLAAQRAIRQHEECCPD